MTAPRSPRRIRLTGPYARVLKRLTQEASLHHAFVEDHSTPGTAAFQIIPPNGTVWAANRADRIHFGWALTKQGATRSGVERDDAIEAAMDLMEDGCATLETDR
jgi:hypothetical protein